MAHLKSLKDDGPDFEGKAERLLEPRGNPGRHRPLRHLHLHPPQSCREAIEKVNSTNLHGSQFPLPLALSTAPTAEPNCSSKDQGWHMPPLSQTPRPSEEGTP